MKTLLIREALAGFTTFLTMAYIVVVNPSILSAGGLPFSGVLTATVLLCFSMTLLMGVYADLPFAVGPGMGLNAFFTFSLILQQKIPWPVALGLTFWAGAIFIVVSATPLREQVAGCIPSGLRVAIAAGIGIFLAFIGLKNGGLIAANPNTFVTFGRLTQQSVLAILEFFLILWLLHMKSRVAFLAGIFATTLAAGILGHLQLPSTVFKLPDFESVMFKADLAGALQLSLVPPILSILFTDLFDSVSTFVGISHATGLTDEKGEPKNLRKGLLVDAIATLSAGLLGTSAGTTFVESSAGIEAGGRTGWTAIFTALCFLPCLFIAPLVALVPAYATAPVLVIIGLFMLRGISSLSLEKLEESVPALLTLILIPLSFSITKGIMGGLISHVTCYTLAGRRREIPYLTWILAGSSVFLLWHELGR